MFCKLQFIWNLPKYDRGKHMIKVKLLLQNHWRMADSVEWCCTAQGLTWTGIRSTTLHSGSLSERYIGVDMAKEHRIFVTKHR